ncbi:MAG: hypothetical protein M1839_003760 [Geoglossum umbratile]|nr:MAG: hypothetical protein M1839_003760 [Geoglossum umbratile]
MPTGALTTTTDGLERFCNMAIEVNDRLCNEWMKIREHQEKIKERENIGPERKKRRRRR